MRAQCRTQIEGIFWASHKQEVDRWVELELELALELELELEILVTGDASSPLVV